MSDFKFDLFYGTNIESKDSEKLKAVRPGSFVLDANTHMLYIVDEDGFPEKANENYMNDELYDLFRGLSALLPTRFEYEEQDANTLKLVDYIYSEVNPELSTLIVPEASSDKPVVSVDPKSDARMRTGVYIMDLPESVTNCEVGGYENLVSVTSKSTNLNITSEDGLLNRLYEVHVSPSTSEDHIKNLMTQFEGTDVKIHKSSTPYVARHVSGAFLARQDGGGRQVVHTLRNTSNLDDSASASDDNRIISLRSNSLQNYTGKTVNLPNCKSIGKYVFATIETTNDTLMECYLPELTNIESKAFFNCTNLRTINIGNVQQEPPQDVFEGCTRLTSARICAQLLNSIPKDSILNITIDSGDSSKINWAYFSTIKHWWSLDLDLNLLSLPDNAFNGCFWLKSVSFPNTLQSIGNYAFKDCTLKSITLPTSLKTINTNAFSDSNVGRITYEGTRKDWMQISGVENVPSSCKVTCSDDNDTGYVFREIDSNTVAIYGTTPQTFEGGNVSLPSSYNNKSVVAIDENAFNNNTVITGVVIPTSITKIDNNAFKNCSNLESVDIVNMHTSVSSNSFDGCSNIKSVKLFSTQLLDVVNSSKNVIESINIVGGTSLESETINEFSMLNSIELNNINLLKDKYITNCYNLRRVSLHSIKQIESKNGVLYNCPRLSTIDINFASGCSIGQTTNMFANTNSSYVQFNIHENMTTIPARLFARCDCIDSFVSHRKIRSIGNDAFAYSTLTSIDLSSLTLKGSVSKCLSGCSRLQFITIPYKSLTKDGDGEGLGSFKQLFGDIYYNGSYKCFDVYSQADYYLPSTLTKITLNGDTSSLNNHEFSDMTSLTEVNIGGYVYTYDASDVFANCTNLWCLRLGINAGRSVNDNFLRNLPSNIQIKRLQISATKYQALSSKLVGVYDLTFNADGYSVAEELCKNNKTLQVVSVLSSSIGKEAFYGCDSLHTVKFGKSLTKIGYNAFGNCSKLTNYSDNGMRYYQGTEAEWSGVEHSEMYPDVNTIKNKFYNWNPESDGIIT